MTSKEAIEVLSTYDMSKDNDDTEFKDAVALAIKALEREPCEDAISRTEALKQAKEWRNNEFLRVTNPYYYLEKRLNNLPSVALQEPILDKIRAEINAHKKELKTMAESDDWYAGKLRGYECAIEIIDKYRQEASE